MDAKALTLDGGDRVVAMCCGKCGRVHSPMIYMASPERAMAAARSAAEECCAPRICQCGAECPRSWLICDDCREAKRVADEAERRAAATVVEWDAAAGEMLYDPFGDRYVSEEWEIEDEDDPPPYAYATIGRALHIDAEDIVESALESGEHYENARDMIGDVAMSDLQLFLDGWCQRVNIVSWFPDYSRVVVFEPAATAAETEEE